MAVLMTACSSGPALRDLELPIQRVELSSTPFFAQDRYQCGPAALATVLVSDGVEITPDELVSHIYIPERQGSLQAEIIAATRRFDRVPYVLEPSLQDLLAEVASGKPVLVLQNLGIRLVPQWHYAVVIGYDAPADSLLLRSGTNERLSMTRSRFLGTWVRADQWALLAVAPDQPPVTAQVQDWLRSASAFEELGRPEIAAEAYEAATRRWPDQPLAWNALANARYAMADLTAAESALRHSLQLHPSAVAYNNLAHVLSRRGCAVEAMDQLVMAESMDDSDAITALLLSTRQSITAEFGYADQSIQSCRQ